MDTPADNGQEPLFSGAKKFVQARVVAAIVNVGSEVNAITGVFANKGIFG
ncbi:MAG: hypothetical protein P4L74_06510 [Candidatus Doudnabacteria bacterium]|nr:hypothetical protein [Candidatus Doudnabacteria bacterium]